MDDLLSFLVFPKHLQFQECHCLVLLFLKNRKTLGVVQTKNLEERKDSYAD
ncbi:unnamed protein product [Meloidogyne enterolobii]|uniref:Uncharacterized protein n=1 Tax=Meloidogyne enterolobii TaxID=390850 RepID=A0ACB0XXM9_MELEN